MVISNVMKHWGPRSKLVMAAFIMAVTGHGQMVSPVVLGTAGTTDPLPGGGTLSWTLGEMIIGMQGSDALFITEGFQQGSRVRVCLNIKALLQGAWSGTEGLMHDHLRMEGFIPQFAPYEEAAYPRVADPTWSFVPAAVLATDGADAVVDWVYLELRDALDTSAVVATRRALLQRDGDIVDLDGLSAVTFYRPSGTYFIAVHHRNHLPVLTLHPVQLSEAPAMVDLTDGSTPTYGNEAQSMEDGRFLLWCGDITADGLVRYAGAGNDRDAILLTIDGAVPTSVAFGYWPADVNMDGIVRYVGAQNDRDLVLITIGGSIPTAVRQAQMP